ncbi:MAG: DUF4440 domain-containing protein [Rhodoferax sp.]|nr:DUF4440 domain-containing protein [Rhodoferax sp.]
MLKLQTAWCAMHWLRLLTGQALLLIGLLHSFAQAAPLPPVQTLQDLLHTQAQLIRVVEPHLSTPQKPMRVTYLGWPANQVLDVLLGADWRKPGAEVEFRARDGYVSRVPVERFAEHGAWLVFERVGHPAFTVDNLAQNQNNIPLGPYYLVWDNRRKPALIAEGGSYWPYQIQEVVLSRTRQYALLPDSMPPGDWSQAAALTQKHCLACHQINGYGGNKWPGDLAEQVRTRNRPDFVQWVLNPAALQPGSTMPGLPAAYPQAERRAWAAQIHAYLNAVPSVPPEVQQHSVQEARAQQELTALFKALGSGNTHTIAPHLAPEFQIVRSNGAVYDKAAYLERSIPVIHTTPQFRNLRVTGQGDIRVVSFNLEVQEQINGNTVENLAPQLIVFRDIGTRWVVVASANLAKLH